MFTHTRKSIPLMTDFPMTGGDIMNTPENSKSNAWKMVCGDTYNELCKLRKLGKKSQWLVSISDVDLSTDLISDIKEMTKRIPYKGGVIDMTKDLSQWLSCNKNTKHLASFFS